MTQLIPGARSTNLGFFVGVGSRHETADEHGSSHMLEHLLFKGTRSRDARQISAQVEQAGGDLNAWTARDHTCFHAQVLPEDAPGAASVIADMLTDSLLRTDDVASEAQVVLDEIAMHDDDPVDVCADLAQQALFGDQPLGRSVIGTEASIRGLGRDDIEGFWRRHYRGDNIVVVAAGDVDHDQLAEQLAAVDWPGAPVADSPSNGPASVREVVPGAPTSRFWGMQQTTTALVWPGFGWHDPRRHALSLVLTMLGGGMSSLLFQRVREELALAYTIDAGDNCWDGAGSALIEWQSLPGRTGKIFTQVRGVVHDLLDGGVDEASLATAQRQVRGQLLLHLDQPANLMGHWGLAGLRGDDRSVDDAIDDLMAVTPDEATEVARQVLSRPPRLALAGAQTPLMRLERSALRW
ncbi:M16 family metallopeptidase [Propionibacteriaceae bacterium G57]|uniref:M16 family metallopeptidase n=1 Tax=Aestuariimicrobium sp. G57 TaxID=3418485 RepID=UPI003DA740BB